MTGSLCSKPTSLYAHWQGKEGRRRRRGRRGGGGGGVSGCGGAWGCLGGCPSAPRRAVRRPVRPQRPVLRHELCPHTWVLRGHGGGYRHCCAPRSVSSGAVHVLASFRVLYSISAGARVGLRFCGVNCSQERTIACEILQPAAGRARCTAIERGGRGQSCTVWRAHGALAVR